MAWDLYFSSSSVFQVFDVGVVVVVLSLCLSLLQCLRPCVRFRVFVSLVFSAFDYNYYFIHFLDI